MENRYDHTLREANRLILDLTPANVALRLMLAFELKRSIDKNPAAKILELGCGEGDLTACLFKTVPDLKLEALDISPEMLMQAKVKLKEHVANVVFIQDDAAAYLHGKHNGYDVIVSAWTIHNFAWPDKQKLFAAIFESLKPGGVFLLMDKVYEDDQAAAMLSFALQNTRYLNLGDTVRDDMLAHEMQDFTDTYRMQETQTLTCLSDTGFIDLRIIDRVTRDIVLTARK